MTYLRTLNGEKSLSVVKDYFTAMNSSGIQPEILLEKKQMAEKALQHLTLVMSSLNPSSTQSCPECTNKQTNN